MCGDASVSGKRATTTCNKVTVKAIPPPTSLYIRISVACYDANHYCLKEYCNIAIYCRERKPPKQHQKIINNIEFSVDSVGNNNNTSNYDEN